MRATDTQKESFASCQELRATEKRLLLEYFRSHPEQAFCRADLIQILGKPINHVTRTVFDLMEVELIAVSYKAPSNHSKRNVEYLKLKEVQHEK